VIKAVIIPDMILPLAPYPMSRELFGKPHRYLNTDNASKKEKKMKAFKALFCVFLFVVLIAAVSSGAGAIV